MTRLYKKRNLELLVSYMHKSPSFTRKKSQSLGLFQNTSISAGLLECAGRLGNVGNRKVDFHFSSSN
jgi:hypothetical protein